MTTLAADSRFTAETRAETLCAHCGLVVPTGLIDTSASDQFCCAGCRTVYSVIHSCRMDQYYNYLQRDRDAGGAPLPAQTTGKAYREFDDPGFLNLHAPLQPNQTRSIDFFLEGVHCAACIWLVERITVILPAIVESRLDFGKRMVRITWVDGPTATSPTPTTLSAIARLLDSLGYPPHPARSSNARQIRLNEDRRQLILIGVAGACAGNTMLLAIALYAGVFSGMDSEVTRFFRWLSMCIGLIALAWPGSSFFRGAWAAIRTRTPHLDLPIALGLTAGGITGTLNTVLNIGDAYFDSLSVLVFLLLVGRFLQSRRQAVAQEAVELLFSLTPMSARRVNGNAVEEVPISALQLGDTIEVLPGDAIPVDGRLLEDMHTSVDESLLTGESRPVQKGLAPDKSDSLVFAGTTNIISPIRVHVLAAGEATRVGKIMRMVVDCSRRKAPLVLLADRIAGWFLVGVLAIAAAVLVISSIHGIHAAAVNHAIAILIVACPCALGLATPLAVTVAIGRAARRGILLKGGDTIERLSRPGLLLLDKTGTLTSGRPSVRTWNGDDATRRAVAAIESHATHPVARALAQLPPDSLPLPLATDIQQDARGGISGIINTTRYWIGTTSFALNNAPLPAEWSTKIHALLADGFSPVVITRESHTGRELCALAAIGDTLRPDAKSTLASLQSQGWKFAILSGDHPDVVARIAKELNISDARGGLFPEQKLDIVHAALAHRSPADGPVVMVGDGVNDAAALAAASVGVAVHGGVEASLSAASVYLSKPGLTGLSDTIYAARSTVRAIHICLAASILYNLLGIFLAAVGWITPLFAAILMPVSSLTVISLALAVRTFPSNGDSQ